MSEPTLQDRFHLIGIGGAGMSVVAGRHGRRL